MNQQIKIHLKKILIKNLYQKRQQLLQKLESLKAKAATLKTKFEKRKHNDLLRALERELEKFNDLSL